MSDKTLFPKGWLWLWQRPRRALWLGVAVLLGLALLSTGNLMKDGSGVKTAGLRPAPVTAGGGSQQEGKGELGTVARQLESQLKGILEQVRGAGRVEVSVTLAAGPMREYAVNTRTTSRSVEEKDQNGGTRLTKETNADDQVVMARAGQIGGEGPVVIKESMPKVQGVLVVADGAEDPVVRAQMAQAVQTLLGIAAHQVQVLPRR
ncbi:MAG: stage sporulation protein [Clostridia bacterium]|nr:stage sporulation protein [Clostridia bacterium]